MGKHRTTEGASADELFRHPRRLTDKGEANWLERQGWDVQDREQFGQWYAVAYPPGFTHRHGPRCVGLCTVPSKFVRPSSI